MSKSFKLISVLVVLSCITFFMLFQSSDLEAKGDKLYRDGQFYRAYEYYQKAFDKDETNDSLAVKMIDCQSFSGNQVSARVLFDEYDKLFPNNLEILNRGIYLYDGNVKKVIEIVKRIILIYEQENDVDQVKIYTSYLNKITASQDDK